jgi:hypothetical protein
MWLGVNGHKLQPLEVMRQAVASKDVNMEAKNMYGVGSRYQETTGDTADC